MLSTIGFTLVVGMKPYVSWPVKQRFSNVLGKQNHEETFRKRYAWSTEIPTEKRCFLMFSELFKNIANVKSVGECTYNITKMEIKCNHVWTFRNRSVKEVH